MYILPGLSGALGGVQPDQRFIFHNQDDLLTNAPFLFVPIGHRYIRALAEEFHPPHLRGDRGDARRLPMSRNDVSAHRRQCRLYVRNAAGPKHLLEGRNPPNYDVHVRSQQCPLHVETGSPLCGQADVRGRSESG